MARTIRGKAGTRAGAGSTRQTKAKGSQRRVSQSKVASTKPVATKVSAERKASAPLPFNAKTPVALRARTQMAVALLAGVTRTDDGGNWNRGLLREPDATPRSIRAFVSELSAMGHCEVQRVAAGRTPIGGGWQAHSSVTLTESGREYLQAELARSASMEAQR
jgi:hypothetical protein